MWFFCESLSISAWFNATVSTYWKHLYYHFCWLDLLLYYPIWRIYIWSSTIQIYFLTLTIKKMNTIKDKIAILNWCFQLNLIFRKKWLEMFFYNPSALSLIIISMLSLFKCMTCFLSVSFPAIKLIAIFNWVFEVSDFLRLFMTSFKCGLLRLIGSLFVFYLLPLICNNLLLAVIISSYLTSLIIPSSIALFSFFSLKIFFISLILLSSISLF